MGFWKSVAKVISAPVTLPAKGFSNILDTVAPDNAIARKVSDTFAAPWEAAKGGYSAESLGRAFAMSKDAINLAGAAATGGGTSLLGFDASTISGLTDVFGNNPAGTVNPVRSAATYQTPAPATPFRSAPTNDFLKPALVIGGAGVLAYFLFRGKK